MTKAITIKASTLEGQLIEVLQEFDRIQTNPATNPTGARPISFSINQSSGIVGFSGSIPIDKEVEEKPKPIAVKSLFGATSLPSEPVSTVEA